jgi:hypothetical protein
MFIMHVFNCRVSSPSCTTYVSRHVCSHDVLYEYVVASLLIWSSVIDAFILVF